MMSSAREKLQSDFDLERFIEMFDEALTSNDERVINALRQLMMMVILTKPEVRNEGHDMNRGPLRQLFEDMHNLNRRLGRAEEELHQVQRSLRPVETYAETATAWQGFNKNPYQMEISKEFGQKFNGGLIKPTTKKGI